VDEFLPIGEQDLPHALAWDEISPSLYDAAKLPPESLAILRARGADRLEHLPEFALLKKSIARFQERQAEKAVSLNLEQRRAGKAADKAFREESDAARKALEATDAYAFTEFFVSPPPPPRIKAPKKADDPANEDDPDADADETDEDTRYAKMDVYLRESLRVLEDLRTLPAPAQVAGEATP
jgi:carboxyl-terminal processing protease